MGNDTFDFSGTGKLAFTVKEVRDYTGLSISSIYRLIRSNRLRSVKIEGRRFVMRCDLEAMFAHGISVPRKDHNGIVPRNPPCSKGGSHEH